MKTTELIPTQENDDGVNVGPQRLGLLWMQGEANAIGPVEVAKQPLAGQGQEGNHEAKHPNAEKDGDGSPPAWRQVLERVHDADVFLQRQIREEQHGHFGGQHGQGADDLTLAAVHPGLSVTVVLASELQVVRADHEEVDSHQPVSAWTREGRRNPQFNASGPRLSGHSHWNLTLVSALFTEADGKRLSSYSWTEAELLYVWFTKILLDII